MSTISAGTTTTTALVETGDTTGNLVLQVNGTTPSLTLNTAGAHGVGASPSYGTSGQVLTSAGSAASPTWTTLATPPASAMTLISTQTASSSASIAWTGLSGYDKYMLIFQNLIPDTAGASFYCQLGFGATPTYITSGYYSFYFYNAGGTLTGGNFASASQMPISVYYTSSLVTYYGNQTIFEGFTSLGGVGSQSQGIRGNGVGMYATGFVPSGGVPITALKIYFQNGNITSGTASLYGISS